MKHESAGKIFREKIEAYTETVISELSGLPDELFNEALSVLLSAADVKNGEELDVSEEEIRGARVLAQMVDDYTRGMRAHPKQTVTMFRSIVWGEWRRMEAIFAASQARKARSNGDDPQLYIWRLAEAGAFISPTRSGKTVTLLSSISAKQSVDDARSV